MSSGVGYLCEMWFSCFFFQAEDGIRDLVRSRGLGDVYKRQVFEGMRSYGGKVFRLGEHLDRLWDSAQAIWLEIPCLLYTSDAADERSSVDLGGRRILKTKKIDLNKRQVAH